MTFELETADIFVRHCSTGADSRKGGQNVMLIYFSAVSSVVDQSTASTSMSSAGENAQPSTQTTAYIVPIVGAGAGGQGTTACSKLSGSPNNQCFCPQGKSAY